MFSQRSLISKCPYSISNFPWLLFSTEKCWVKSYNLTRNIVTKFCLLAFDNSIAQYFVPRLQNSATCRVFGARSSAFQLWVSSPYLILGIHLDLSNGLTDTTIHQNLFILTLQLFPPLKLFWICLKLKSLLPSGPSLPFKCAKWHVFFFSNQPSWKI